MGYGLLWRLGNLEDRVYPQGDERRYGGVAFVEAGDRGHAMQVFREQYDGEYLTVQSIEKI